MKSGVLYINDIELDTLLAISRQEQEQGLMWQKWPPPIMSFCYNEPRINKFWMKSTPSPLDIVFSYNGIITNICYGEPHSTKLIGNDYPSDLVVELPRGTCEILDIKIGDKVYLK